jgi:hypothetical protein
MILHYGKDYAEYFYKFAGNIVLHENDRAIIPVYE